MNAFNLTIEATTALNLPIDYTVFSWGISINSIGASVAEYPNEWWHFWIWNSTTNSWMMSIPGRCERKCVELHCLCLELRPGQGRTIQHRCPSRTR